MQLYLPACPPGSSESSQHVLPLPFWWREAGSAVRLPPGWNTVWGSSRSLSRHLPKAARLLKNAITAALGISAPTSSP